MKRYIWIVLVVLLAGFLRFYHLSQAPPALNSDEVAIGYNAYSILQTGKDEYNTRFPLTFRSFDDYKMPVYVYMTAASMKLFGYGDFAVRFPSALFGTLTVLSAYLLVKELFMRWDRKRASNVAIVASFLLAISPWSLHFSRAGYEANVAVFFITLGVWLFLLGLKRGWMLVASSIVLSFAVWTYLTPRIFVPLLVLGLAVIYRRELWNMRIAGAISGVMALIFVFPIIRISFSSQGQMRAAGVSAFANPEDLKKSVSRIALDRAKGATLFTIFDNRRVTYAITFLRGYFSHFDPNFLFLDKSINKYRAPDMGLLYLFELPLLLAGAYMLVRKWSESSAVLFWWVIVAPVAAAFTLQLPHPVRTLVFLPSLQIISGIGLVTLWERLGRIRWVIVITVLLSVIYYLHQYYAFLPVEDASYWYVGRKEMVGKLSRLENRYDRIMVSNSLDFPYIFFLYYYPVDPAAYQRQGGTVSGGFLEEKNRYGKYEFRFISTSLRSSTGKTLFAGLPGEVFKKSLVVDTVHYPDGSPAIVLFE